MVVGKWEVIQTQIAPKLFDVQSVNDSSNRTKLPFSPARTLLRGGNVQGQQTATVSRQQSRFNFSDAIRNYRLTETSGVTMLQKVIPDQREPQVGLDEIP